MEESEYLSEFEDLLKLKDFAKDGKMKMPFDCTFETISKALRNEYIESINEKIKRWINVTHIMYFRNSRPVTFYFQSKMLYRDGFYEASIALSRSICEMICYDLISKIQHPFGNIDEIEVPMFRIFVNYLVIPKKIEKQIFEDEIINQINIMKDRNFLKSSYNFNKHSNNYKFKNECGKKKKNLDEYSKIFKQLKYYDCDQFRNDTHEYLHKIYDIGNKYIHSKKIETLPKDDANECLNMMAHILSDIYGVKTDLTGKIIKSGYVDFPDICKGMNFALTFASTPEDAQRIYFNLPSKEQIKLMMGTVGTWNGEWKNNKGESFNGNLLFYLKKKDHLCADLLYKNNDNKVKETLEIKLFGNYFHLIGFDEQDMKHKKNYHVFFELEFFNKNTLIGHNVENNGKVIFLRESV